RYARSLARLLAPGESPRSPLLSGRSAGNRLLCIDVRLDQLKAGGATAGGSVNDSFLAAVLGGMRRYHEQHGVMADTLMIGMPVSLRTQHDPLGGNRFAGVRFAGPLAERDPAQRIRAVREFVLAARGEPAIDFL